jgi:hypothetical protein
VGDHLEHLIELRESEHPQRCLVGRPDQHQVTAGGLRIPASTNQRGKSGAVDESHPNQIDDHHDGTGVEDLGELLPKGRRLDGIESTEKNDRRRNSIVNGEADAQASNPGSPGSSLALLFSALLFSALLFLALLFSALLFLALFISVAPVRAGSAEAKRPDVDAVPALVPHLVGEFLHDRQPISPDLWHTGRRSMSRRLEGAPAVAHSDEDRLRVDPTLDMQVASVLGRLGAVGVIDDVHADLVHGEFHLALQLFRLGTCRLQRLGQPRA